MSPPDRNEIFPEWDRNTRPPVPLPPPGSTDCQMHIYEDPAKYPPRPDTYYEPPDATFADGRKMLRTMGFDRVVIVHPMPYGSDHRLLIDTLENTPDRRENVRATCIVDDSVSDAELARLDALGVVGARFNFARFLGEEGHSPKSVRRGMERIREIGWHARLHVAGQDLLDYADTLLGIKDLTMVIDHMGHLDFGLGLDQPACRWILDRLKGDGWWMMVSNGNRCSSMDKGWDDAVPFGKAYIEAAPERIIWGSDWPHVRWQKTMMNDADEVELFYRYIDNDPGLMRKILVDNPAHLHGFP